MYVVLKSSNMSTTVAVLAWEMKEFLIGLIRFDEKRELLLMLSFNLKKVSAME